MPLDVNALIASGGESKPSSSINHQLEVTPMQPTAEDNKPISLDAFRDVRERIPTVPGSQDEKSRLEFEEQQAVAAKKAEEEAKVKAEAEAAAKVTPEAKPSLEVKPEDSTKPPATARSTEQQPPAIGKITDDDLKALGISESAIPVFRKSHKEAQELMVSELRRRGKEAEELKTQLESTKKEVREGLPSTWYENENAYQLLPEYQKINQEYGLIEGLVKHFRQQLIAIKEGVEWEDLVMGADGKINRIAAKPGADADVRVSEQISSLTGELQRRQQQAQQLAGRFQLQSRNIKQEMQKAEDQFFPQYKEKFEENEHGKYALNHLKSVGQEHNVIAPFTRKLYAEFMNLLGKYEALEKEVEKGKVIKSMGNGPTGDQINKGAVTEGPAKPVNPDDSPYDSAAFEKAKGGY